MPWLSFLNSQSGQRRMSTNKGCEPGKSSLIGLGSVIMMDMRSYRGENVLPWLCAHACLNRLVFVHFPSISTSILSRMRFSRTVSDNFMQSHRWKLVSIERNVAQVLVSNQCSMIENEAAWSTTATTVLAILANHESHSNLMYGSPL